MNAFDAQVWKAQRDLDDRADNPRSPMVPVLLREHLKPGMSHAEVLDLLGPPDFEDRGAEHYALGRAPYGIDFEYLVIRYADDKLVQARLERT